MQWYAGRLLWESIIAGKRVRDRGVYPFEETVVLFKSNSISEAKKRAHHYGLESEHSYKNTYGETVSWRFRAVLDVMEIIDAKPTNKAQIYTQFLRKSDLRPRDLKTIRMYHTNRSLRHPKKRNMGSSLDI